jgi:hypothetical protein
MGSPKDQGFRRAPAATTCGGIAAPCGIARFRRDATTQRDLGAPTDTVPDLELVDITASGMTVRWTQVDDGTGEPARYRVKFAESPIDYSEAEVACTFLGDEIGTEATCPLDGIIPGTTYDVQLVSFRVEGVLWMGNVRSNVATGTTDTSSVGVVDDLEVVTARFGGEAQGGVVAVQWTQVHDGTGQPASYRLRYDAPLDDWKDGEIACERTMQGTQIGGGMSCRVEGLLTGTVYDFQLMSFRQENGVWVSAEYSNKVIAVISDGFPPHVEDLRIVDVGSTSLTMRWTQINDGSAAPDASHPAWYRVKYAPTPLTDWASAAVGCEPTIQGEDVGSDLTCTITGLEPGTEYDIQLKSFWVEEGIWQDARFSNIATGTTAPG